MDGGEKKEVRRPMNAFLIFCKRHRGFVREKNPDMDNRSVTRVLGDLWANLGEEKKIYTNLAKQYKDAFMKANPNYKWHSADKSHCSSSKVVSKPTNSRVIKNVAEIHTDGSIVPGKLADPEKMGGLNLLLMADKETCESRSSSSSMTSTAPSSLTRTTTSFSTLPVQTNTNVAEQSIGSNSALLQLAEMCTSELQGSRSNKPLPNHLYPLALTCTPSSSIFPNSTDASHQPMPPPKKRARHWSLSEAEISSDSTNDNCSKEYIFGSNLPQQSSSLQKLRCSSVGATLYPEDKYPLLEKYKPASPRRTLSSSATESIPSPSGPNVDGIDDADSPVFSPDITKLDNSFSDESKLESHERCDQTKGNFRSEISYNSPGLLSERPTQSSPLDREKWPVGNKLFQEQNQASVSLRLQPLNVLAAGVTRSMLWSENKQSSSSDHHLQHASHNSLLVPLYSGLSPEVCGDRKTGAKSENSHPDFYMWREPGKPKTKGGEFSSGNLNLQVSSHPLVESCSSPILRLNPEGRQFESKNLQHMVARLEPTSVVNTVSQGLAPFGDLRTVPSACSPARENTSLTSALGEGRIASILSNPGALASRFSLNFSNFTHSASEALSKIGDEPKEVLKGSTDEPEIFTYKQNDQGVPARRATSADVDKSSTIPLQTCYLKMIEPGSSTTWAQSSSQSQTFSEGKLKKKWTERMLIEAMLKEERPAHRQTTDGSSGAPSHAETDTNQNISPVESKPESSKLRNFIDSTAVCPRYSNNGDLQMAGCSETPSQIARQALLILNQPHGSFEDTSFPRNPTPHSTSSHTKLMLQLSQNQQTLKPDNTTLQPCADKDKIKLEPGVCNMTSPRQDQTQFCMNQQHHGCSMKVDSDSGVKSEDLGNKQAMSQIAACGKKFMDRIVEQLCKTDFSGNKPQIHSQIPGKCTANSPSKNRGLLTEVKQEPGSDFKSIEVELKEENSVAEMSTEEARSVRKSGKEICSPPSQKDGLNSCRKADQVTCDVEYPCSEEKNNTAANLRPFSNVAATRGVDDSSKKSETCGQVIATPSDDVPFPNQWPAVTPEACDHSDVNEDAGIQPVRKSRRANRGQKYQELIKEGFIQPSRERLASRNADRHGRSFGTREEFEKMEMRRTLKRSASERDTPSDCPVASSNSSRGNAGTDGSMEKRFTSGDFDLEKEIESLPVCSLEQLDKKKVMRRRCDSDTLGALPCHRNNADVVITATVPRVCSSTAHAKPSPCGGSALKLEDLRETGCPAPHIPLPREERPIEPITGSRKRKARKHCITRISVLDEKTLSAEKATQKCHQPQSSQLPQKKLCIVSEDVPRTGSSKSTTELSRVASSIQTKSECDILASDPKDFRFERVGNKMESGLSLTGDIVSEGKAVDKVVVSTFNALPDISLGGGSASLSISPPQLSALSVVPSLKAASSSPSSCDPVLTANVTLKKNNKSSLSHLSSHHSPPLNKVASPIVSKPLATGAFLKSLTSAVRGPVTAPVVLSTTGLPLTENAHSAVKNSASEEQCKQFTALPARSLKSKMPSTLVLSSNETQKKKCLERKPRKIAGSKTKLEIPKFGDGGQASVIKAQCALKRKFAEKKVVPIYSKCSNTPLVSALLGHSDLSTVLKLAERGESKMASLPQLLTCNKKAATVPPKKKCGTSSQDGAKTTRIDFPSQALTADAAQALMFKTQLVPLNLGHGLDKADLDEAANKDITFRSRLSLLDSTQKAAFTTTTTSSEAVSLGERLTFAAAVQGSTPLPHKSRLTAKATVGPAGNSSTYETTKNQPTLSANSPETQITNTKQVAVPPILATPASTKIAANKITKTKQAKVSAVFLARSSVNEATKANTIEAIVSTSSQNETTKIKPVTVPTTLLSHFSQNKVQPSIAPTTFPANSSVNKTTKVQQSAAPTTFPANSSVNKTTKVQPSTASTTFAANSSVNKTTKVQPTASTTFAANSSVNKTTKVQPSTASTTFAANSSVNIPTKAKLAVVPTTFVTNCITNVTTATKPSAVQNAQAAYSSVNETTTVQTSAVQNALAAYSSVNETTKVQTSAVQNALAAYSSVNETTQTKPVNLQSSPAAHTTSTKETAKIKPSKTNPDESSFVHVSGIVSQLQPQHVSIIATASSFMTSAPFSGRTSTSLPYTCTTLHNSLLSQVPAATVPPLSSSLSSSDICTSSSTFSSTSPLLPLTTPHSLPSTSSAVLSSPTVISSATSAPSNKNDIVSYTVIGSSSVMDAGSPHMIGSPHLPESPSVAIVQS